jgi:integrase
VQTQPTGKQSWYAIYKFGGRKRDYRIGAVTAIKLDAARKLAGKVMLAIADGKDPQADRKAERSNDTFEEVAKMYFVYASKKNKSWRQPEGLVRKNLLPRLAKTKAANVSRSDMKAAIAAIKAPITANQTLAAASRIFSWALKEEVAGVTFNPCARIERNPTTERERILSDSELPKFWREFGEAGLPGLVLKVLLLLGQRPGEVKRMRREHIGDGYWTLPGLPVPALNWLGTKNWLMLKEP